MADRIYDRELPCGCMLSSDAGGCVIPCYSEWGNNKAATNLCRKSWDEWLVSEEQKIYEQECMEKNG